MDGGDVAVGRRPMGIVYATGGGFTSYCSGGRRRQHPRRYVNPGREASACRKRASEGRRLERKRRNTRDAGDVASAGGNGAASSVLPTWYLRRRGLGGLGVIAVLIAGLRFPWDDGNLFKSAFHACALRPPPTPTASKLACFHDIGSRVLLGSVSRIVVTHPRGVGIVLPTTRLLEETAVSPDAAGSRYSDAPLAA